MSNQTTAIREAAREICGLSAGSQWVGDSQTLEIIEAIISRYFPLNGRYLDTVISCWHCGVVLAGPYRPRCEQCPDECDTENCDAMGCRPAQPATDNRVAEQLYEALKPFAIFRFEDAVKYMHNGDTRLQVHPTVPIVELEAAREAISAYEKQKQSIIKHNIS